MKPILKTPWHGLQVAAPAGSISLPPQGFDGPVVTANPGTWVATAGTGLLLNVEASLTTSSAHSVRLVVPEAEAPGSFATLTHDDLFDADEMGAV